MMSYNNVVQLSGLAVALGGYMALVIWAYSDIWIRGRKTIYTNVIDTGIAAKIFFFAPMILFFFQSHFFFIMGLILTALGLTELIHFFLFLANHPSRITFHWYQRHIQAGLMAALGIHQSICNYFNINMGLMVMSLQFTGLTLLFFIGTLLSSSALSLSLADEKWILMSMCLLVTTLTIATSWQQLDRISPMSMLATKVVILYQLIMLAEAVVSLIVSLICHRFWMDYDQMMEDLVLPLFPLTYLLMVRRRNLSQWIFKFLNDKGGASSQRLPSETLDDNCQEMSDTISLAFPSTVFSVVSDDDNDDFL